MTDTMQDMLWCEACDTDHDTSEMVFAKITYMKYSSTEEAERRMLDRHDHYRRAAETYEGDDYWAGLLSDFEARMAVEGAARVRFLAEFLAFNYVNTEVAVCTDRTNVCRFCGNSYVKYDDATEMYSDDRVPNGRRAEYWSFHERACYGCSEIARECDICSELGHIDEMEYIESSDYTLCGSCFEHETVYCETCQETYLSDRHDPVECGREEIINDYSYRPDPTFYSASDETVTSTTPSMGIELEVECTRNDRYDDARMAIETLGDRAYLKHDGSLDDGFEIVTHPHTLAAYQTEFPFRVLQELSARGVRSWNTSTCGLHVHISRSAFNGLTHQAMFTMLFQGNPEPMRRLAGRHSEQWAKYGGESDYRTGKPLTAAKKVKPDHANDRYQAVNTMNHATIEVRIFRGSMKRERVLSAIELVHAVFTYTAGLTSNNAINGALTFDAFKAWLDGREQYANLAFHIEKFSL